MPAPHHAEQLNQARVAVSHATDRFLVPNHGSVEEARGTAIRSADITFYETVAPDAQLTSMHGTQAVEPRAGDADAPSDSGRAGHRARPALAVYGNIMMVF